VNNTVAANYVESSDAHFCAGTTSTGTYVVTINNPHTVSGFDMDSPGNCTLAGPGVLTLTATGDGVAITNGGTLTISNVLAGTGGGFLNVSGNSGYTGTLILGGSNTFTGNSSFGGLRCITGTVIANNDACFGTSFINMSGGTLSFPAGVHTVTNKLCWAVQVSPTSFLSGAGTVNFNGPIALQNANTLLPTIIFNGTGDVFFNGVVSDVTRGAIMASGAGAGRIIFANNGNNYTGWLYARRANIAIGNTPALSGGSGNQLHFDGVAVSTFLQAYGGPRTLNQVTSFDNYQMANTTGLGVTVTGSNTLTFAGAVDLYTNNPSETMTLQNTADTIISGQIVSTTGGAGGGASVSLGANRCGLNINGPGRLVFKNANNVYTGDTVVNSGTLCLQNTSGDATGTGTVQLNGGTLSGTGFAGLVSVNSGGTVLPGSVVSAEPGTLTTTSETWAGGGNYNWAINNGSATEGADPGWSKILINGALNITASSGSQFNINITSLTAGDIPGMLTGLIPTNTYTWRILTATGGITGFSSSAFNLNTNNFSNTFGGTFAIVQSGNDLDLIFTGVPNITAQPQDQLMDPGNSANFTVTATGAQPLSYQWYYNGGPIPGATDSSYTQSNIQPTNIGTFYVTVTNSLGSVTSSNAQLYVSGSPVIVISPQSQTNSVGSTVTFTVSSSGSPTLFYQWYYNDTIPIGPNSNTLTLTNIQNTNAGKYSVDVANGFGDSLSPDATLTVIASGPSRFINVTFVPNTGANMTATGTVGAIYYIQGTTNFNSTSNWVTLTSLTNTNGTFQYLDSGATNLPQRYYRTKLGP
jgi:autotransporter-associated beta strand protein